MRAQTKHYWSPLLTAATLSQHLHQPLLFGEVVTRRQAGKYSWLTSKGTKSRERREGGKSGAGEDEAEENENGYKDYEKHIQRRRGAKGTRKKNEGKLKSISKVLQRRERREGGGSHFPCVNHIRNSANEGNEDDRSSYASYEGCFALNWSFERRRIAPKDGVLLPKGKHANQGSSVNIRDGYNLTQQYRKSPHHESRVARFNTGAARRPATRAMGFNIANNATSP
ncbi:hypothetical protein E2C01_003844 [Portunus trituberculatus]|uniref:Uncharacterized protein n=1 Tax=Portunus trituberculatus TaxID=210409 RepID=A0A5B7CPR1_PORTR|nr:hypothetical protein [Portunus trituberculatus]